MHHKLFAIAIASLVLVGCKANEGSIDEFIVQADTRAAKEVALMAPEEPFTPTEYTLADGRPPFVLPVMTKKPEVKVVKAKKKCWQPTPRRKSSKLEQYPLSKLRLKGMIGTGESVTAIVQIPTGNIARVKPGHYMGKNHGKVSKVTSKYILVNEVIPDGVGCWSRRTAKLSLR